MSARRARSGRETSAPVRTALVTGSSGGIGRAIAEWLAREGRVVGINGRDAAAVQATVDAFTAQGWRAFAAPGDVTRAADVAAMVDAALAADGSLDILVNNAGGVAGVEASPGLRGVRGGGLARGAGPQPDGRVPLLPAAVPHMKAHGWGRIVNVASESARVPIVPRTAGYAYAAAKSGILGLSRVLASRARPVRHHRERGGAGLHAQRAAHRERSSTGCRRSGRRRAWRATKVKRWAELPEIASAVGYLASEEASYCIGAVLDVNGGSFMP